MATRVDDVIELLRQLSQMKEMKAAYDHSMRGAVWAGLSAFVGGMLVGPPGFFVGGAFGGLLGYWRSFGQFKPVPQILLELPPTERKKLYEAVCRVIRHLDWADAVQLTALVMGNAGLQQKLIAVLSNYLCQSLRLRVAYGR